MTTTPEEKERAKQIILEIVRQGGGTFYNKTNMYKAFYWAHLRFADSQPGYLSAWPIVRMPRGPGIHDFDKLLGELLAQGKIVTEDVRWGEHVGTKFRLCDSEPDRSLLSPGAVEAIAEGVERVRGKFSSQASHESHADSRAWREAKNGEELNIYLDLLSDEEYRDHVESASRLRKELESAWEA